MIFKKNALDKVINGRLYDTRTATHLADYCHTSQDVNGSEDTIHEDLYRKDTGEYFLVKLREQKTRMPDSIGKTPQFVFNKSTEFIPVDETAAKTWAADRLSGKKYMKIFGRVSE